MRTRKLRTATSAQPGQAQAQALHITPPLRVGVLRLRAPGPHPVRSSEPAAPPTNKPKGKKWSAEAARQVQRPSVIQFLPTFRVLNSIHNGKQSEDHTRCTSTHQAKLATTTALRRSKSRRQSRQHCDSHLEKSTQNSRPPITTHICLPSRREMARRKRRLQPNPFPSTPIHLSARRTTLPQLSPTTHAPAPLSTPRCLMPPLASQVKAHS
jgi:hypothetical protein